MGTSFVVSYLKLQRARVILGCCLISVFVLSAFPAVDIGISRVFFEQGFLLRELWWYSLVRDGLTYFICLSMILVLGIYVFNRLSKRDICRIDGRKVSYLFLVLILGAGLVVNVIFKDHFGRARPRDIQEFGGSKQFTPAFVISDQCDTNCSFSSGEGAAGFFSLALALALSRRRAVLLAALGLGGVVSILRVASGAHFFSDIVVSLFVMLIFTDVLYYYVVLPKAERERLLVQPTSETGVPDTRPFRSAA
jgi:lipid A 4'-phosphatase